MITTPITPLSGRNDISTKEFQPQIFLNQFDFICKYNKNYNRHTDCSDYLKEIKKEILLSLERQKT